MPTSFEREGRPKRVGRGGVQGEFPEGDRRKEVKLTGEETGATHGLDTVTPLAEVPCTIAYADGTEKSITLKCRLDTGIEIEYIENGGVLHYVFSDLDGRDEVAAE